MKLDRILVIVDKPKHRQVAIERAAELARLSGAHLDLVAFVHSPIYGQSDSYDRDERQTIRKALMNERQAFLAGLVEAHDITDLKHRTRVVWTVEIGEWVAANAPSMNADLVIKSAHRSRTIIHTPTDWQLLRTCPVPLLLAVARKFPARARILATLDLRRDDAAHKRLNSRVMTAAASMAKLFGAETHCCFVIEQSDILVDLDVIDGDSHQRRIEAKARPLMQALAAPHQVAEGNQHMPTGKVGQAVNSVADRIKAKLIVLGTTARRGVKGMVLGNSAEKVLARVQCDVLALRP